MHLHNHLNTILFRHLEVEQHKVNRFNFLTCLSNRNCFFKYTLRFFDYLLTIDAVGAFLMQTEISQLALKDLEIN